MKLLPLFAVVLTIAHAGETTVELKPFRIERTFSASVLPAKPLPVAVAPDSAVEFVIEEIRPHGTPVKKGEVLVKFDRETIDRLLEDQRRAIDSRALALATQELAFTKLEEETKLKLTATQRAARVAAEDLDYFTKVGLKTEQEQAKDSLQASAERLAGEKEELAQLQKMYLADDVTEETEEIVLKRQRYAVQSAELRHRHAELATKRTLDVSLPRQMEAYEAADKNARIALEKAEKDLPRGLAIAKIELEGARAALERARKELAKLEGDAKLMILTAPADGLFYHGAMEDGRWTLGELARQLVKGGRVPQIRPFATIVPTVPEYGLVAQVDEATARSLAPDLTGGAIAAGREDLALSATVKTVATVPAADGRYRVDLAIKSDSGDKPEATPADLVLNAGMTLDCRFIVHDSPAAASLPLKALKAAPGGKWTVDLKLADGKTEARPIKRGRMSGDRVEILSGVEAGQVVVIPD